jgi:phage gpG-like protein
VIAGLEAIGVMAESHAKENCPVDTGRLRNSISNEVSGETVYIGTNVEYAAKMELTDMNHKVGQAHFLRDAATTHNDQYKSIMETALKA